MNSIENKTQSAVKSDTTTVQEPVAKPPVFQNPIPETVVDEPKDTVDLQDEKPTEAKIRSSFFGGYLDKIKDFLDNAE